MAHGHARRGYIQLVQEATAESTDLADQLGQLTQAADRGAHPDDVAAAVHVLCFGAGSPSSLTALDLTGPA